MPRRKKIDVVTPEAILAELEKRIDGHDLLSEIEKEEIRAKARAHVDEQRKKKAVDAFYDQYVKAEENKFDPNEQMVELTIELGDYAPCIAINGAMQYYHGVTYRVPRSVALSLNDIMWQTQQHQREIEGKRRKGDILAQPLNMRISPSNPHGNVTGRGNLTGRRI